ncbi:MULTISPECIES: PP2C family protein-serine/threonine phosphatase [unclassified Streptomyces]|uniref:PP2C family protein-serine/threonine phosphatase n=1 Tax=unclassified Streptomyces TaxID=2593676 RepID=UPI002E37F528|nr:MULTISPECIES: PP2C family protein-serine/threonine phosphatase [unclassified Streptomyces]WUC67900.1 serine/threonine-protein phosphatase [Streptomyces sp. NBC_00539]
MSRLFWDVTVLREEVRDLARSYRLPADVRGRLVLSVTDLACPEFEAGHPVRLTSVFDAAHDVPQLNLTLTAPRAAGPLRSADLPLTAPETSANSVTWHIPLPDRDAGPCGEARAPAPLPDSLSAQVRAADEELRAALARADHLTAEHRLIKHELAETNAGVLALYVQLDERDEQVRKAHGQVLRELEDALRPLPPEIDGLELAVHYAPADPAAPTGGDLYDWFALPDGTVHVTVVDALGHGVRSTRGAVTVTHAVRTLALEGHPLPSILARTHHLLMPFNPDLMATVLLVRLDPATGDLQVVSGSHPPPLLVRHGGTPHFLEATGRGIGFPSPGGDAVLRERMEPGDLLLLYTDGLTESRRDLIEGESRLIKAVEQHAHRPIAEIPDAVAAEMHTVVLHADDTLALAMRMTAKASMAPATKGVRRLPAQGRRADKRSIG